MKKPETYTLDLSLDAYTVPCVSVFRTVRNIGRIGIVFPHTTQIHGIPAYIVAKAKKMIADAQA